MIFFFEKNILENLLDRRNEFNFGLIFTPDHNHTNAKIVYVFRIYMNWQVISEIYGEYKHDLVDLTFARMQNYAEMQFGVIVNLTK